MAKKPFGKIIIDRELCKGCALCVAFCPRKVIRTSEKLNRMGYYPAEFAETEDKKCNACTICATTCPDIAIEVYRE